MSYASNAMENVSYVVYELQSDWFIAAHTAHLVGRLFQ